MLDGVEIAEHLESKRRQAQDPVEANRWEDGLEHHPISLTNRSFTEDEAERLKTVIRSWAFDNTMLNHEVADEPV